MDAAKAKPDSSRYAYQRVLLEVLKRKNKEFDGETEGCAAELSSFILEKMSAEEQAHQKTSVIADTYGCRFSETSKCQSCSYSSKIESPAWQWILPVPKKNKVTIEDCANGWYEVESDCPKCEGTAITKRKLQQTGTALAISLERNAIGEKDKQSQHVDLGKDLQLDHLFSLFAVVEHIGKFTKNAHYVCYIKQNERWYRISDHDVEEVSEACVLSAQATMAYLRRAD